MTNILSDIEKTSQILGKEKIGCLENLFEQMNGQPPRVNKKRYRADHALQIDILEDLENADQLIRTEYVPEGHFYYLRTYALPLVKTQKAENLLNLMEEIYKKFPAIYRERLDAPVTREELLKIVDAPIENILEALSYFKETHDIRDGWENGFPYKENTYITLSEKVVLERELLEILMDYSCWNFINKKNISNLNVDEGEIIPEIIVEDKKTGRPSLKNKIISAYSELKKQGKIEHSKPLKSHTELIQETVKILFPEIKNNTGMEHEAIRRAVGSIFKQDKNL